MFLKHVVDEILKEKTRPLSWLAEEMGKTFDGLKLSLVKGSIKYNDIITMAKVLEVTPSVFFQAATVPYDKKYNKSNLTESKSEYNDVRSELKNCKEMVNTLKDQLKDKEKIISLLS